VGRVVAKPWEKGKLLGLDMGLSIARIKELEKILGEVMVKFGEDHVRNIFPDLLLTIYFGLIEEKPEIIVIPFKAESTGRIVKRETGKIVDFLVLKKLEIIEDKGIGWIPIKLDYLTSGGLFVKIPRAVIKPSNFEVSLNITKKDKEETSKKKEGKNIVINIWSNSSKKVEVISDNCAKDKKLRERDLAIERITYEGRVYEIRSIEVDIDKEKPAVEIKKYEKIKREAGKEKIWIKAYLGKELTKNKKPGCRGEHVIELMKKEIEKVIARTEN